LLATLLYSGTSFRRFFLTIREIYFTGVLSLIIILVSGLFVGMVLGLQGYDTLQRYGSSEALGILVACRWCANSARWLPPCCSPAAPVRRSPPKSA
jgi:ABC-type transporter Mla maintaining outer membrane lipid asymmetry permease subunit MlaE